MDTVTPTSDAPPALCPTCGCSSTVAVLRPDGGVMYADYKCRAGHIWITHWLVAA